MNALTRSMAQALPRVAGRRTFSATSTIVDPRLPKTFTKSTMKKDWLSDPTTYPIAGIVVFACTFCSVFAAQKLIRSPDVRIVSAKKHSHVRLD